MKDLRQLHPSLVTTVDKINYRARIQAYRDLLLQGEHNPIAMMNALAKLFVHIEVAEDSIQQMIFGDDASVPSDLFRLGDWFQAFFPDKAPDD